MLHLLAGLEVVATGGFLGLDPHTMATTKARQRRVRHHQAVALFEHLLHAHEVSLALGVELAHPRQRRLQTLGPFEQRHLDLARAQHLPHRVAARSHRPRDGARAVSLTTQADNRRARVSVQHGLPPRARPPSSARQSCARHGPTHATAGAAPQPSPPSRPRPRCGAHSAD